jgi:hypothetical protein
MNIIAHYKENKSRKMTFMQNMRDIYFHLHNGKKSVGFCIVAVAVNYYICRHYVLDFQWWIFILSSEYFVLEIF